MRVQLAGVTKSYGAQLVLDDVTLVVGPHTRLGVVGPNGIGKTTLLRLLAGLEQPDTGRVLRDPPELTAGYLPQEPDVGSGETLLSYLARRTGVGAAERDLERRATQVARGAGGAADAYASALDRYLALGAADLPARARSVCAELGLAVELDRPTAALSGGERARAALAAILLARFDLFLLDEPTNDLDFDGLERLERFLGATGAAVVLVSHDRALLDRAVTRIAEIDEGTRRVREVAGGWTAYEQEREQARRRSYDRWEHADERRREVAALLARRRTEARAGGATADRRGTHALMTKVRQAERALERVEQAPKPFEPWRLRLSLEPGERAGDVVAALEGAVAERGDFRLGPVDLALAPGERLAVTGRNGSGKSTLLGLLLGTVPLAAGRRLAGRRTVAGALDQRRDAYAGSRPLLDAFRARTGLAPEESRTLLAKFGLGADDVGRPTASLSPGERTRAQLAELQARGVNLLVLDEPTNHLDLEAIEQLEGALAGYTGTLVVVSHDRRFLDQVAPARVLELPLRPAHRARGPT